MHEDEDLLSGRRRPRTSHLSFWRDLMIVVALALVGLHVGAGFLVPLVGALLLFVLLAATVDKVASWRVLGRHVPRWAAHVAGLSVVAGILGGAGAILAYQVGDVIDAYPRYRYRIELLLWRTRDAVGEENAETASQAMENADYTGLATYLAGSAGTLVAGALLVALYLPFMMIERGAMRRKLRVALRDRGMTGDVERVIASVSGSLKDYIGVKTLLSLLTALFSYAVMKPLGLDFAETWALLTFALNFIPAIGSVLGVVFPAIIALVQFDGLTPFLVILFGCGIVQAVIGNVLEPALAGRSLNLSPLSVLISLSFWTALWGVAGAFLSAPITVGVMIVLAEFRVTRPVAILLSGNGRVPGRPAGGGAVTPPSDPAAPQMSNPGED